MTVRKFTFDVKACVTVHVTALDEPAARELVDEHVPGLIEGGEWRDGEEQRVFVNSAGLDGEHDLTEVDGESPDAEEDT